MNAAEADALAATVAEAGYEVMARQSVYWMGNSHYVFVAFNRDTGHHVIIEKESDWLEWKIEEE